MRLIFLLCLLPSLLGAQKALQLEKYGKAQTQKFYIGEEITYLLAGEEDWFVGYIEDINAMDGYILFGDRLVTVTDIVALKSFKTRAWSRSMGKQFYSFGAGWAVFATIDELLLTENDENGFSPGLILIPPAIAVATGWLIQRIFRHRIIKMGKRHRLRLIDLTVIPIHS